MGRRNKLEKFEEMRGFPNVYQNYSYEHPKLIGKGDAEADLKNSWSKTHFKNDASITLELACGRGEYTNALAKMYPDRNFIGLDIKGARIWKGAKQALSEQINNAAFLRTKIELLPLFFGKDEVDEIWITFPDPFLREVKQNRRLTSNRFLDDYKKVLKKEGRIHLKTDNVELYEYTLEVLEDAETQILYHNDDIYANDLYIPELEIKTYYERMHLKNNLTIKYIQFKFI